LHGAGRCPSEPSPPRREFHVTAVFVSKPPSNAE
jgi:hypothetical protein